MKIAIAGGYGVFGSRLAEILIKDGHDVVIAGRSSGKAHACAEKLGCTAMAFDLRLEPQSLFAVSPDLVVDAAGPFHSYGKDPYALPRLCLANNADYLDLSDNAAFTAGIRTLDAEARRKGRRLLSGASSVPGLSSSIAADLCADLDETLLIETAILPGNRAPRGASVIASIVGQLGTRSRVWRGGAWRNQMCWTDPRRVSLAANLERTGYFIEVPDITLFPKFFRARSVMFRAGMELGILNAGISAVGLFKRRMGFEATPRRTAFFQRLANALLPFGTDRGGMQVVVIGQKGTETIRREWRLVAEAGDGPRIPAVTVRALIRSLHRLTEGARPCLAETTRCETEAAMSDLRVSTVVQETPFPFLFQSILADRWDGLPPEVQRVHRVVDLESFSGKAKIIRGATPISRLIAWIFGFPNAADSVPVTVTKWRTGAGEIWERNFAGRIFQSYCRPGGAPFRFRERFGPFNFEIDLSEEAGCLRFPVCRGWFLGLPLPKVLLPKSESREFVLDGVFHFDVALSAPLNIGLIVHYYGHLKPDG